MSLREASSWCWPGWVGLWGGVQKAAPACQPFYFLNNFVRILVFLHPLSTCLSLAALLMSPSLPSQVFLVAFTTSLPCFLQTPPTPCHNPRCSHHSAPHGAGFAVSLGQCWTSLGARFSNRDTAGSWRLTSGVHLLTATWPWAIFLWALVFSPSKWRW